jgi:sugar phosphate isomerase/epimerase
MKVAISSQLFKSFPLHRVIDLAREREISWLEVWSEHFWRDDDGRLMQALHKSGLELSVHGPIGDLNIASSNPGIRRESVKQVLQAVEGAARMGAGVITVHPGYMTGKKDSPESIWDSNLEALTQIANRGKEMGILVGMETMENRAKEVVMHPDLANRIVDTVNMDNLGVTFDISHAHTVMNVVEFINSLRKIIHVHISDTKSGKVHFIMGEGEIAFGPVLQALKEKYDGALVIEGWHPKDEMGMVEKSTSFLGKRLAEI